MPAGPWDKREQQDVVGEDRPGACGKAASSELASGSLRDPGEVIERSRGGKSQPGTEPAFVC